MANLYVSSVAYTAVAQFAVNHAYSLADIVRQRGAAATQTITVLTSVTTTATATVTGHGFVTGQSVLISGATQTNYNKQTQITVVDANTFTYTIVATTSPATGAPVVLDSVAINTERCFRCTTAGTSSTTTEPTWTLTNNGTTTSAGATFTECTGQEAHQHDNSVTNTWTAPAARWNCLSSVGKNTIAAGDTLFLSSDHAETQASANALTGPGTVGSPNLVISVSRTSANLPPLAAQVASGAAITTTSGGMTMSTCAYIDGVTLTTVGNLFITFNPSNSYNYYKNCALVLTNAGAATIQNDGTNGAVTLDNTTMTFSNAAQSLSTTSLTSSGIFEWKNTASAILGTVPTTFIGNQVAGFYYFHGVDLSALGSNTLFAISAQPGYRILLANCKLGSSFVLASGTGAQPQGPIIEVVNCDSANTNYRNERYMRGGTLTTETTITLTGGATDGTQGISHKMVTNANANATIQQLDSFPIVSDFLYANPSVIGNLKTATIEIISSGSLNNNDIWLDLEYPNSSTTPLAALVSSNIATPLTTAAAVTTSTATWNSSPATPTKQKLQVTFTPQKIGMLTAWVRVAKATTTVYINPQISVT